MNAPGAALRAVPAPAVFPMLDAASRAAALSRIYAGLDGADMVREALLGPMRGRIALVSSFGAESVALLHLVAEADLGAPVIFLDTEMLFPETLTYQAELAAALGLRDIRIVKPVRANVDAEDPKGDLWRRAPDACCALRKTAPLAAALEGFDGWITGRKRYQGGDRAALAKFETDDAGRLKLNPLANWGPAAVRDYIHRHDLPSHPLVARGYPSIGCAPCTSAVAPGEDPRAGRWRGRAKTECGIHFVNGAVVRREADRGG